MSGQISRRTFLVSGGAVASVLLAGCSSDDSSPGGGDSQAEGDSWQEILDSRDSVNEDGYQSWSWETDSSVELRWEFTVRSGPAIEVFMMESTEFDEYQAGNRFYAVNDSSGTSGSDTFSVEGGNYRFVIDNSNAGEVSPPSNLDDDVAEVELTIEAQ